MQLRKQRCYSGSGVVIAQFRLLLGGHACKDLAPAALAPRQICARRAPRPGISLIHRHNCRTISSDTNFLSGSSDRSITSPPPTTYSPPPGRAVSLHMTVWSTALPRVSSGECMLRSDKFISHEYDTVSLTKGVGLCGAIFRASAPKFRAETASPRGRIHIRVYLHG
ncbi:hypothetical protein BD311DRAFT_359867 [Dichomitus squalens]|uniref:Uncharacterized protein n=1 Tax=Dichomitus squalens TaxID=114155 RepID=A0A4V2K094_9APHY|nr:hypothetical protein BD311DRAFT_359867 [Dichomitus squalens]